MKHRLSLAVRPRVLLTLLVTSLVGCSDPDSRLGELALQVTHEQAQQNQRIAEGSKVLAQGSQQLVEADAKARRELIDLQQALRQDQSTVAQQRDALEAERKDIANHRRFESSFTAGAVILGVLLACLAPLILAGISLMGLWRDTTREEEGEVLIGELAQSLVAGPGSQHEALPEASTQPRGLPPAEALPGH
jgi:hypothetical protein